MSIVAKKRSPRPNPHDPLGELTRFFNTCAEAREKYSPENFKRNVGEKAQQFYGELTPGGKKLLDDMAGLFKGAL